MIPFWVGPVFFQRNGSVTGVANKNNTCKSNYPLPSLPLYTVIHYLLMTFYLLSLESICSENIVFYLFAQCLLSIVYF